MVSLVIDPVTARLPERIREAQHRVDTARIRVEQTQSLMQTAQRMLLRSQGCLAQSAELTSAGGTLAVDEMCCDGGMA